MEQDQISDDGHEVKERRNDEFNDCGTLLKALLLHRIC